MSTMSDSSVLRMLNRVSGSFTRCPSRARSPMISADTLHDFPPVELIGPIRPPGTHEHILMPAKLQCGGRFKTCTDSQGSARIRCRRAFGREFITDSWKITYALAGSGLKSEYLYAGRATNGASLDRLGTTHPDGRRNR